MVVLQPVIKPVFVYFQTDENYNQQSLLLLLIIFFK